MGTRSGVLTPGADERINLLMTRVALLVVTGWLTFGSALASSQPAVPADLPPSTTALVERFADGRTIYSLVSEKPGRSWTPMFPRIASWRPPAGMLPIGALQFSRVLIGQNLRVETSLLLGDAHEQEVHVATVMLTPGARVSVEELRGFGIEPVELWIADATPLIPTPPRVVSVTPELEIATVEILTAPYPGYRITVRNLAARAAANFRVQSYRNNRRALSALKSGKTGHPVLLPRGNLHLQPAGDWGTAERRRPVEPGAARPHRDPVRALV